MASPPLAMGFADPARDAQRVFKALMSALARPGRKQRLAARLSPPPPLTPELAAVALTLLDFETAVWLDAPLAGAPAVSDFLRFHAAPRIIAAPHDADFALISDAARMPPFEVFAQGTPDYPDRATTLLVQVAKLATGALRLEGPGIAGRVGVSAAPLPDDFPARIAANAAGFPLGIDLFLIAPDAVVGLPRSVRLAEGN
ncbi:phosphonate C-P lyase system protein PhnH [Aquabacter spiritensis]|uniref:Alpha-D-ribose 1-methylphosphonate 5-triphosphate synthase subunit PhnH n=1 Tax=Aquabacter spiritensis TaxID=933073 RepID=A0A4R3LV90_9HYPH|nr:phosphonate C-P lyase system protein PhnH [Aquabacter spiritensis]TCT02585.1 alpha-D-ribose 1-methylphosphonate 5-triphosphate synthase subunit PhnH [Aquabacter spiritensis]